MATREKVNKQKVLDYIQDKLESAKQMKFFQILRRVGKSKKIRTAKLAGTRFKKPNISGI